MLSISLPMKGSGRGDYYLSLAKEDYYLNGGEPPGEFYGDAKQHFNLPDQVDRVTLRALLEGLNPDTGKPFSKEAAHPERRSGWDLTFSAPKSVSVIWALGGDEIGTAVGEAHKKAVKRALDYLQQEAAFTRRGKGGHIKEEAVIDSQVPLYRALLLPFCGEKFLWFQLLQLFHLPLTLGLVIRHGCEVAVLLLLRFRVQKEQRPN